MKGRFFLPLLVFSVLGVLGLALWLFPAHFAPDPSAPLPGPSATFRADHHESPSPDPSPDSLQVQFEELSEEVSSSLPTLQALKDLSSEEVHEMPLPLQSAGAQLGRIAMVLEEHPELSEQVYQYYSDCALRQDLPTAIRALCYSHLPELDARLAGATGFRKDAYPEAIRALAEQLAL